MGNRGEKARLLQERIERNKWERFPGKICNCFYRGEIYRCTVESSSNNWRNAVCYIHKLDIHVSILSFYINWSGDRELEQKWIEKFEKRQAVEEFRKDNSQKERSQTKYNLWNAYHERRRPQRTFPTQGNLGMQRMEALKTRMKNLCGVGSRKVKFMLIASSRRFDDLAMLLRLALEIETFSIQMMEQSYPYNKKCANKRTKALCELLKCCKSFELIHGKVEHNGNTYLCVEIPDCETLGFHIRSWTDGVHNGKTYNGEWDKYPLKNLKKIEECINRKYSDVLDEKRDRLLA